MTQPAIERGVRTPHGFARAKDEDKTLGRPRVPAKTESAMRAALEVGNMGMHRIADRFGVSTGTVQRIRAGMEA